MELTVDTEYSKSTCRYAYSILDIYLRVVVQALRYKSEGPGIDSKR